MLEVSSWDLEFPESCNLSPPSLPCDTHFSDGHSLLVTIHTSLPPFSPLRLLPLAGRQGISNRFALIELELTSEALGLRLGQGRESLCGELQDS